MSQNSAQEKTEKPTEKRLKKARKDGQIARSKELNTAVLLMLNLTLILGFADMFFGFFVELIATTMQLDHSVLSNDKLMPVAIADALLSMLTTLCPMLFISFMAMWIAGSLPGGAIFSSELLGFKLSKLSIFSGFSRMFGMQSWVELLKSIIKVTLLGGCLYGFLTQLASKLLHLQNLALPVALHDGLSLLFLSLIITVTALLLIAAIDVPFQQHSIAKKIKMTHQEVKEERKSSDGSPEIKGRIRQIQHQIANRRIEDRVPKADVIITNPTHFAVAIRYSEDKAKAPYVVAKGVDEMALRIKEVARKHNKEVLEFPPLARAIYHSTRVDQEVPAGLYTAVAYVLTYVMQLKAYKSGNGQRPAPIPDLSIPSNLLKN
jgi:flagellar biosynthetic protein FlhB